MGATKKELEEVKAEWANFLALFDRYKSLILFLPRLLFRLPILRRRLARTQAGRTGLMSRLAERGEYEKAAAVAIEALKDSDGSDWWFNMEFAARCLNKFSNQAMRGKLVELARNGVEPFQGYNVASSFLVFSRWKFRNGEYDEAIEFAKTAANADETWADPDFMLGWYCLVLGGDDAMKHLARAVRKDPHIRPLIMKDPEVQRHPHLVQKLKNLPVEDIETERIESEEDDGGSAVD